MNIEIKMKLAQTNLSKLRRSDLFVENRSAQDSQLRRSGIFGSRGRSPHQFDVAPTELKNLLIAFATKISRLRRWGIAKSFLSKPVFSAGGAQDSSPRRQPWVARLFRSSSGRSERIARLENLFLSPLRGLRRLNISPTVVTVGYYRLPLRGCEMARK